MRSSSASVAEAFWCDPRDIRFKISPFAGLSGIRGDDWDLERRHEFKDTAKYRAIHARFVDGKDWRETELFTDVYARRMARDGRVGRCRSIEQLAQDYDRRFVDLFRRLKRDGFKTDNGKGKIYPLPALLIGRGGEIFIGNQGNHRLAMAQILGLPQIAGKIICRHQSVTK